MLGKLAITQRLFEFGGWAAYLGAMRISSFPVIVLKALCAGVVVLAAAGAGLAEDNSGLPGVEGGYRIVKPREDVVQPELDQRESADAIKVGEWDVKVSGSVTVDIGTIKPGR